MQHNVTIIWELKKKFRLYITFLLITIGFTVQAFAQPVPKPDFDAYFRTLYENAIQYNLVNDSIFLPTDRKSWVKLFLRRSDRLRIMFKEVLHAIACPSMQNRLPRTDVIANPVHHDLLFFLRMK